MIRKGIILAGGAGSRLYPLTLVASKQLQAVYDKPMIYYPLTTLMLGGVREFCLISTPHDLPRFEGLLGDGSHWGLTITYREQPHPGGLAQAYLIAEDFIAGEPVSMILGDNVFHGLFNFRRIFGQFTRGGHVFAYPVNDPERYGVVEFDSTGRAISVEEKPSKPRSRYAIPGLYLFDGRVASVCRGIKPSPRGELEITEVIKHYLELDELTVSVLGRGFAWLDTGTSSSLKEASDFIALVEARQSLKIGCPEEVARRMGFISQPAFETLVGGMPNCAYADYLRELVRELAELGAGNMPALPAETESLI